MDRWEIIDISELQTNAQARTPGVWVCVEDEQ
jgi:hypothetical protein